MSTVTRQELVNAGLAVLGASYPGQVANAEDYATVDGAVDGLLRRLLIREIVNVQDVEAVPAEYLDPLAVLLADAVKDNFSGGTFDVAGAENSLRHMTRSGPTYEVAEVEYF